MSEKYDLVILGAGMAGIPAMKKAADLGAKAAAVVGPQFGGTCLNAGCIPTKALWECVRTRYMVEDAGKFGVEVPSYRAVWRRAQEYKAKVVETLRGLRREAAEEWGVKLYGGSGFFTSPHEIQVNGTKIYGEKIVIATGARPYKPPIEGIEYTIGSDEALELEELPESIFIIGMGPIGLEFATFFSGFGSKVYLARRKSQAFPEDTDASLFIDRLLKEKGIVVLTANDVRNIEKRGDKFIVRCSCAERISRITVDKVMAATGRVPNIDGLNLDAIGVKHGEKGISINEYLQTSVPHIYAAGDCCPVPNLTAVANIMGEVAVFNALNGNKVKLDLSIMPDCISTYPWIAKVGLTERQAKEKGLKAESMKVPYNRFPRGVVAGHFEEDGFIKIIYDKDSGKIYGGIIIGDQADNLIHIIAVAMKGNLAINDLADLPFFHPSLAEGIRYASKKQIVGRMEEGLCCVI